MNRLSQAAIHLLRQLDLDLLVYIKKTYRARITRERKLKRARAQSAVHYLVRTGKLRRKHFCDTCSEHGPTEMHHPDYDKPKEVLHLCHACHLNVHGKSVRKSDTLVRNFVTELHGAD